jgi:hypothetical protein
MMVKKIQNERRTQKKAAERVIMFFLRESAKICIPFIMLLPDSSTPPVAGQAGQSPAHGGINH